MKLGLDLTNFLVDPPKEIHRCVVKLTTSYWSDEDGCYIKQSLKFLKRKCKGYNILYEDCKMISAEEVVSHITNLHECEDGVYQVVICNERSDWETPNIIDDYDYKLVPFKE